MSVLVLVCLVYVIWSNFCILLRFVFWVVIFLLFVIVVFLCVCCLCFIDEICFFKRAFFSMVCAYIVDFLRVLFMWLFSNVFCLFMYMVFRFVRFFVDFVLIFCNIVFNLLIRSCVVFSFFDARSMVCEVLVNFWWRVLIFLWRWCLFVLLIVMLDIVFFCVFMFFIKGVFVWFDFFRTRLTICWLKSMVRFVVFSLICMLCDLMFLLVVWKVVCCFLFEWFLCWGVFENCFVWGGVMLFRLGVVVVDASRVFVIVFVYVLMFKIILFRCVS